MPCPTIPTELIAPAFSPATFANPGAVDALFARLRKNYPLAVAEVPGFDPHWIVTRWSDLRDVTRQDNIFHSSDRSKVLTTRMGEQMMRDFSGGLPHILRTLIHMDEPEHMNHRRVTDAQFMPKAISGLETKVRASAEAFVDMMAAQDGACDFATDIAFLYPLQVIHDLVGVPREDHAKMLRLTQWMFNYADPDLCRPGADVTKPEEQIETWNIVFNEFTEYYDALVKDRRANPRDDLATLIANGQPGGCPMTQRTTISYFVIASTAGHDTTAATTATAMWHLAEHPEMLAQLKADPSLIPAFVEESIRWTSPVKHMIRSAAQDYVLSGQKIREGDLLYVSYVSANRDESVFDDPFSFRLDRNPNKHVSFGFGSHICLGQHLARLEMRTFWETLLPRLESVELSSPARMAHSEFVCGPKAVPIRYRMR